MKARIVKRLQEIVQSAHLESLQRILVISGNKDDHRHRLISELLQHLKPIHLRHLHIKKNQIGFKRANAGDGVTAVSTLLYEIDVRRGLEQRAQIETRGRLVV